MGVTRDGSAEEKWRETAHTVWEWGKYLKRSHLDDRTRDGSAEGWWETVTWVGGMVGDTPRLMR